MKGAILTKRFAGRAIVPAIAVVAVLFASLVAQPPVRLFGINVAACTVYTSPVITSVTPGAGPIFGGTRVTITGSGLCNTLGVKFGSTSATVFAGVSDTQVTATSPAHAAGVVDVTVTTSGGTSAISGGDKFRYVSASYCALINMSRAPTAWTKGHAKTFYVYAFNCGTKSWPATGGTRVDINVHFTTKTGSGFNTQAYWKTQSYRNLSRSVAPNGTATFTITLNPNFRGTLLLEGEMIKLHQFWFGRYIYHPTQFVWVNATVS